MKNNSSYFLQYIKVNKVLISVNFLIENVFKKQRKTLYKQSLY
jgi:hypothetical protein